LAGHGDTVAHAVLIDGISEIGSSAVGPVMRGVRQAHTGQWIEPTGLFTRALASLGSDAIDALIEDIDPKGEYQHVRITILGQIGDERAVEPLRRFLHGTDRPWLMSAVEALGNIGHRSAADDLLAIAEYALDAERPRLRSVYFKALGQVGDQRAIPILLNALPTADAQVEATIAVSLGRIGGEEALDALRTGLARADEDLREAYVEALSVIEDSRAAELLTGAMADQNDRVRLFAAEGLGKLRDAAYLDVLGDALHDSSWRVRVAAAEAIGGLGDRTATAPLLSALRDALTKWDGRAAADALIDLWGPDGQPILDAICSEDDTSQLIWALCSVNALEPLHTALAEGADPTTAAEALKKLGDPRSVDPLLRALADEDADLRADAASALGAIGDPKALIGLSALLLDSEVEVVHAAFRAIQAIAGDEAVRHLIPHLCDRESIRTGAVFEGHIPESTAAASISEVHTEVDAKSLPSRSDYWRCPHCDAVLRKGPARLAKIVVGVGTCANCRSEFSQADIYGGTYDVSVAFDVKSGGVSATTADPPHSSNKNFIEACGSGDAAKVRELLGEGLSADGIDPQWTPLMSASVIRDGIEETVRREEWTGNSASGAKNGSRE
jgi:HEAT repeat protein